MSTRPRLLGISLALFALLGGGFACHRLSANDPVDRLGWIKERVRSRFPDVQRVTTTELHERLERGAQPVLLDVRRADEYAVSHLAGALRVEPGTAPDELEPAVREALADAVRDEREVVVYCSVGYRSARLASELVSELVSELTSESAAGGTVKNLEGSIFEWASRGYPMVDAGGAPTTRVHPYGRAWAWLVDEELRAWEPSPSTE